MLLNIFHCFAFVLHFCNFLHFHYACSLAVLYYSEFSRYFYFLLENLIVALISALNCVKWEWAQTLFQNLYHLCCHYWWCVMGHT